MANECLLRRARGSHTRAKLWGRRTSRCSRHTLLVRESLAVRGVKARRSLHHLHPTICHPRTAILAKSPSGFRYCLRTPVLGQCRASKRASIRWQVLHWPICSAETKLEPAPVSNSNKLEYDPHGVASLVGWLAGSSPSSAPLTSRATSVSS